MSSKNPFRKNPKFGWKKNEKFDPEISSGEEEEHTPWFQIQKKMQEREKQSNSKTNSTTESVFKKSNEEEKRFLITERTKVKPVWDVFTDDEDEEKLLPSTSTKSKKPKIKQNKKKEISAKSKPDFVQRPKKELTFADKNQLRKVITKYTVKGKESFNSALNDLKRRGVKRFIQS